MADTETDTQASTGETFDDHNDDDGTPATDTDDDSDSDHAITNSPWEFDIPDPTALHEGNTTRERERTPDSRTTGPQKHPEKEVAYYSCPFCSYTDPSERVVRTHMTRTDDDAHGNRNAFVDGIFVQARAADDTIVEDVKAPGATRYTREDDNGDGDGEDDEGEAEAEVRFLPEGVTPDSLAAEILDAAIKSPMASYADLADEIYGDRTQSSHVWNTIDRYLHGETKPQMDTSDSVSKSNETSTGTNNGGKRDSRLEAMEFYERTEKQRRTILAWLANPDPDRTRAEIAQAASVSETYVPVIQNDHDWLIEQLQAELDAGSLSFERLVANAELAEPEKLTVASTEVDEMADASDASDSPARDSSAAREAPAQPDATDTGASAPTERERTTGPQSTDEIGETNPEGAEETEATNDAIGELAMAMTILEDAALAEAAAAPSDSPMQFAAQKQLYVITLVQEYLEQVDAGADFDSAVADTLGRTVPRTVPADNFC
jgi:uncharacterized damage-inducible protein DinB